MTTRKAGAAIGGALALVAAVSIAYSATAAPGLPHTSTLSAVFDNRLLIASARVLGLATMLYLVVSIGVRVARGQWVRGVAQLQTDAPTRELVDDQEDMQQRLEVAKQVIDDLEGRLADCLSERGRGG